MRNVQPPDSDMIRAYVGLGSNLDDPHTQLQCAFAALEGLRETRLVARSALYRSAPLGGLDQPDYINAVASLDTGLPAHVLLDELHAIERQQGRVRDGRKWQSRTLDLDLLLYGDALLQDAGLNVPHPGLRERAFVLYPLQEIAPDLVIPGLGALSALVENCPSGGLQRLEAAA